MVADNGPDPPMMTWVQAHPLSIRAHHTLQSSVALSDLAPLKIAPQGPHGGGLREKLNVIITCAKGQSDQRDYKSCPEKNTSVWLPTKS